VVAVAGQTSNVHIIINYFNDRQLRD